MSDNSNPIRLDTTDAVAVIEVDNPPVNAMSKRVMAGLKEALDGLDLDDGIRAVVIVGAGRKAFLAGAQIEEFTELMADEEALAASTKHTRALFDRLAGMNKPTIAALQASAMGGGLEIALACDFIIADPDAKLGFPEVKLGVIAGGGGTQRLPRRIGVGPAKDLLLRGRIVRAEEALALGLVNEVSVAGEALSAAKALAEELASLPAVAVRATKRSIDRGLDDTLAGGLDGETEELLHVMKSEDFREGIDAYLERRKPQFKHR